MATLMNTEKSQFLNKVIETYTDNRVGQYSKYLDTDPTFVTYYAINQANSRADIGTDAVFSVIGPQSPIRYNKIENFPIYFKGGLEPQTNYEDGMVSNEIELGDITFLPNTVVPRPFDHFVLNLPNMVKVLFRINSYKDITIQSNDFYSAEAHAIQFGEDCDTAIEKQVIEEYTCVFENIGTQNSCFILSSQIGEAEAFKTALNEIGDMYNSIYYNTEAGAYIYNESLYSAAVKSPIFEERPHPMFPFTHRFMAGMFPPWRLLLRCFPKIRSEFSTFYDMYLTKFIMDAGLFFNEEDVTTTSAVVYEDMTPVAFDFIFKKTLWYAVLTKSLSFLHKFPYYMNERIKKDYSILNSFRFEDPRGFTLFMDIREHVPDNRLGEYFSHQLLADLKDKKENNSCKCLCCESKSYIDNDRSFINLENVISNPNCECNKESISLKEYDVTHNSDEDNEPTDEEKRIAFFNTIIYNYFNDIDEAIDMEKLKEYVVEPSLYCYEYFPIILFILKKKYYGYFKIVN